MDSTPKIAAHVLLFDVNDTIEAYIANISPHVDKIFAAHSATPWHYNITDLKNTTNGISLALKFGKKFHLIEGTWKTEEDQRNACIEAARREGFTHLIVQDADEFYLENDWEQLTKCIHENPSNDAFFTTWITFWKSKQYALYNKSGPAKAPVLFALNISNNIIFTDKRHTNATSAIYSDITCFHLSYVLNDEQILRKINTWGHANDFDRQAWYNTKWKTWHLKKRNLHPVFPTMWSQAKRFTGPLPEAIALVPDPHIQLYTPSLYDTILEIIQYSKEISIKFCKRAARSIKKRLPTRQGRTF